MKTYPEPRVGQEWLNRRTQTRTRIVHIVSGGHVVGESWASGGTKRSMTVRNLWRNYDLIEYPIND